MRIQTQDFELNLLEHELVLNEDVLVTHGRVLPLERIDTAYVASRASTSIEHTSQKKTLQTLFFVAVMVSSVLVVLEYISALWLGAVVLLFLAYAWRVTQQVKVPTLLLRLQTGEELSLL